MTRRARPARLSAALAGVRGRAEPETLLAAVQSAWRPAAGERVGAAAQPVAERAGTVTVACRSSTWAQELDLLQVELLEALNRELAPRAVAALRFRVDSEPLS